MAREKKKKKKGPFRIEAILPLTIVVVLFGLYFKYYFDSHLRFGLAFAGTQAHGAEVNVGSVRTNFLAPSISIFDIQVTNKSQPEYNIVQIGEIRLKLLWDGLLRGKFVIPESSVLRIQANSKRRRPGRILPPDSQSSKGKVAKAAETTINQLKEKNEKNLLSDVFAIAGGTDVEDQLKKMQGEIASQQKVKELEKELKAKEQEWKKRIDDLPNESELKQLVKRVESLKIDTRNPKAIADSLKKVDQVYREARSKYKDIEAAKKALDTDLKKYENDYKGLEKMVQDDINNLTEKMNIPSLDPKEINKMLLGNLVAGQLGSLYQYKDVAREYIPKPKSKEERKKDKAAMQLTPRERANGVNFRFPITVSYPRFWLQKATISSSSKEGEAGDLEGTLQHLTNNPKHIRKPMTLDFKGGFPKQEILNVTGNITVDHTTEEAVEKGFVKVGSFPVKKNALTKSKDVELGYNSAVGSSEINFTMRNEQLELASKSLFTRVDYYSNATDANVARILKGVTQGLSNLTLNVGARGGWDDLSLNINSNLGQKIADAIKGQISAEIARARAQVKAHVEDLVAKQKGELQKQLGGLEKELGVSLQGRENAIQSIEKSVDKKKKEAQKSGTKKLEKKAKELLKGIKF
jgi:uncharacterized protein (TIGR03545 family)